MVGTYLVFVHAGEAGVRLQINLVEAIGQELSLIRSLMCIRDRSDATDRGITEVLFDLEGDLGLLRLAFFLGAGVDDRYFQGVVDVGQMTHREFNVDNRALDAGDATVGRDVYKRQHVPQHHSRHGQ